MFRDDDEFKPGYDCPACGALSAALPASMTTWPSTKARAAAKPAARPSTDHTTAAATPPVQNCPMQDDPEMEFVSNAQ